MKNERKHMDCRNYAPVDVIKGVCHRTKGLVLADDEHCEHFAATQKCKFCDHFVAGGQHIGACDAMTGKPMTYPDLVTVTCDKFVRAAIAET